MTTSKRTSKKSAIEQRAGGFGWIWPESSPPVEDKCTQGCVLVGLDTNDGPDHKYYDRRVMNEIPEEKIRAMMAARPQDIPPIDLVRIPGSESQFYVKMGRMRVLTMRLVNRRLLEAGQPPRKLQMRVDSSNDDKSAALAVAQENICRIHPNPLDELGYVESLKSCGYSDQDIAVQLGVSSGWVRDRLELQCAGKALRSAIDKRKIGLSTALLLAKEQEDKQEELVAKLLGEASSSGTGRVRLAAAQDSVGKWSKPGAKKLKRLTESGKLHPAVLEFIAWFTNGTDPSAEHGLLEAVEELKKKSTRSKTNKTEGEGEEKSEGSSK